MANLGGLIHVFIITIRVKIQQEVRRTYLVCDLLVFWFVETWKNRQSDAIVFIKTLINF